MRDEAAVVRAVQRGRVSRTGAGCGVVCANANMATRTCGGGDASQVIDHGPEGVRESANLVLRAIVDRLFDITRRYLFGGAGHDQQGTGGPANDDEQDHGDERHGNPPRRHTDNLTLAQVTILGVCPAFVAEVSGCIAFLQVGVQAVHEVAQLPAEDRHVSSAATGDSDSK